VELELELELSGEGVRVLRIPVAPREVTDAPSSVTRSSESEPDERHDEESQCWTCCQATTHTIALHSPAQARGVLPRPLLLAFVDERAASHFM
jgi:hypothetical protein